MAKDETKQDTAPQGELVPALGAGEREVLDRVLRERRTVHEFLPDPPPRELVEEALELSRWAPNHKHTNPWRWYRLGRRTIEKVCGLNARTVRESRGEEAGRKKLDRWLRLPSWYVLTAPVKLDDPLRHQEDYAACCCAAQNFMLALWARGLGAKWSTGPVTRNPEFYELLGIDAEAEHVVGLFWVGYPKEVMEPRREELGERFVERP